MNPTYTAQTNIAPGTAKEDVIVLIATPFVQRQNITINQINATIASLQAQIDAQNALLDQVNSVLTNVVIPTIDSSNV